MLAMAEPKVHNKYVEAFVGSAGAVSPVFERKTRSMLADHGIEDIGDSEWVSFEDFHEAMGAVEDEVGDMTLSEGGREMAKVNDLPESVSSIEEALERLNDSHQRAHRNGSADRWGSYMFERLGERRVKVSCSKNYPYPCSLARGVFEGIVKIYAEGNISPMTRPVDSSDLDRGEKCAFDISW
jgi:hypothetical protein